MTNNVQLDDPVYLWCKFPPPILFQSSVSHQLLSTVENLQSALLFGKAPGDEPTVLTSPSATMYMHR